MNLTAGFRNFILIFLVLFSSCGLFKKSQVDKGDLKIKTEERKDITTDKQTVDLSIIKEVINVDTNLVIPGKTIEKETEQPVTIDSLFQGMDVVRDGLVKINIQIDKVTGKLKTIVTLNEQKIPFQFHKETSTQNNISTNEKTKDKSTVKSKIKDKPKAKKTEPANSFWLFAICAVAVFVVVGGVIFYIRRGSPRLL